MTFTIMKIARLGFEPKLSESESLVLPLHYQAGSTPIGVRRRKYTDSSAFAKVDFLFFSGRERFLPWKKSLLHFCGGGGVHLPPWRRYGHSISRSFNLVGIAIRLAVC